jgi:hypothetical protein
VSASQVFPYVYTWKNNEKRATLCGRRLRIVARLARNSRWVEFEDGTREVISGTAIRKARPEAAEVQP